MNDLYIITHMITFAVAFAAGIYFASQVEKGIDNNIKKNKK